VTTDDPLAEAELTFLLGMAFQLVLTEFNNRLADAGYADLRPIHGMAFQALKGPGATSTELAERLGVTKQAAGQIVDDLETRGYVRREPHPDGGRRKLVVLTPKAQEHLAIAGRTLHNLERQLGRRLGDPKLTELRTDLARLVRELAGDSPPPLRPIW
jgi:DNA-binding MarR family transcriptional regulator